MSGQPIRITEQGELLCPSCGHHETHHDRVAAHSRVEDGVAEVVVVDVPDTDPREPPAPRPHRLPCNPSGRRSGVVIEGWCEGCQARWYLNVAQHKGLTLVSVSAEAR